MSPDSAGDGREDAHRDDAARDDAAGDDAAGDDAPPEGRSRFELVLVLCVYVVPLLAASVLLVLVDLAGLALALLLVEAAVAGVTLWAKRSPAPRPDGPARRPWLVPLAMVCVMAAAVAAALLAAAAG